MGLLTPSGLVAVTVAVDIAVVAAVIVTPWLEPDGNTLTPGKPHIAQVRWIGLPFVFIKSGVAWIYGSCNGHVASVSSCILYW